MKIKRIIKIIKKFSLYKFKVIKFHMFFFLKIEGIPQTSNGKTGVNAWPEPTFRRFLN